MATDPLVEELVRAANAARHQEDRASAAAEVQLEARFHVAERLAVYGSLAPGRSNHHVVAPLGGEWKDGFIEGDRHPIGWGTTHGYPAIRWRPGGPRVDVKLLVSSALPAAWRALDDFEGSEYRRSLVPVYTGDQQSERRLLTVANIYECRAAPPDVR